MRIFGMPAAVAPQPVAPLLKTALTLLAIACLAALPAPAVAQAPAGDQPAAGAQPAADDATPPGDRPSARAATPNPLAPVTERAGLPRVLLIGDSISIGYTLPVRKLLAEEANVLRPGTNCGPTTRGLEQIDAWLGEAKWDVIHFNFGLHDLKYIGADGKSLADPQAAGSRQQVPIEQYRDHLERLVQRLQKTGAELVWCSTTPVPPGAQGRVVGDAKRYNDAARQIMQRHGIAINDLYAAALPRLQEIQRPANVHFTPAGSDELAQHVAQAIRQALQRAEGKQVAD